MFKKRERPQAARKVEEAPGDDKDDAPSLNAGALAAKKARRGASAAAAAASSSVSGETPGVSASTKKESMSEAAMFAERQQNEVFVGYKAGDGPRQRDSAGDATRRLEVDTDISQDHRAVLERNAEINKGIKDGTLEKGVYRGLGAYKQYANRSEQAIANAKYTGLLGPLRSSMSNVRSTVRVEYAFSAQGLDGGFCKDYKETGYCGFGDSCKFAHDRGDYKSGYQLEKEWEDKMKAIEEKKKKRWEKRQQKRAQAEAEGRQLEEDDDSDSSEDISDDDDNLPGHCPECGDSWEECKSQPIQTTCGHHFCEDCAMTAFAKSPKCVTCGANTNGIFNSADTLLEKLKLKKERKAERKRMRHIKKIDAQKRFRDPFAINTED